MSTPRIRSVSVRGFRAYGSVEQTLNLPTDIAAVWGPNSKGKTSLAEAVEFLFAGRISRRELMASSQDEFADSLRNAHLVASEEAYVSASIIAADGTEHQIKRTVTSDYRVHFNTAVLTELLNLQIQVVVLTQDHATWEELETRYRHLGIAHAQLYIETPAEGSIIENTRNALLAKVNRARSLARGGHPDSRKECGVQLRDADERFGKEMLVNQKHAKGDLADSLTDLGLRWSPWPFAPPVLRSGNQLRRD